MGSCAENAHNVACPKNGKTFILEMTMAQKGTCDRGFLPKMAQKCINICIDVLFLDFLVFKINETPILGLQTFYPGLVAPPQNVKSFFPETRNPDFGTVINDNKMITK